MTPPPRKYAEAPGMASSAAEIRPPAEDSDTPTVSRRWRRSDAMAAAFIDSSVGRGWLMAVYCTRYTRPATARTWRGAASQMARAENELDAMETTNARS